MERKLLTSGQYSAESNYLNEQGKVEMQPAYKEDLGRDTMPTEEKQNGNIDLVR